MFKDFAASMWMAAIASATPGIATDKPHDVAVKLFVDTMAMAQVASDRCADILVNAPMLREIHDAMHVTEADDEAVDLEARSATEILIKAISEAPSRQAWCDSVYRLYGPEGTILPRLMLR